jgi:hypothetical protein
MSCFLIRDAPIPILYLELTEIGIGIDSDWLELAGSE